MNKCKTCGKRIKENTKYNRKYCQGHSIFEVMDKQIDRDFIKITIIKRKEGVK